MKITRLKPPTLEEVQRTISALEKEFRISSGNFATNREAYSSVPEDAAAEWDLALQQFDLLRPVEVVRYWQTASVPECNDQCETYEQRREAYAA